MLALLLFFIILLIVFSIPAVQTTVARKITDNLKENQDVDISIDRVSITYSGKLDLDGILVRDHHQDTLFFAEEMKTSVLSLSALLDIKPYLGNTTFEEPQMNLKVYEGEERDNLAIFAEKFKSEPTGESIPFQMRASDIVIVNGSFRYIDENLENPEILILDQLNANAQDLLIDDTEVFVDVRKFSAVEDRGLQIDFLQTGFAYTENEMRLEALEIRTPESFVKGDIIFDIQNGFSGFTEQVPIIAEFEDASLSTNDLQLFYSEFGDDQELEFTTTLKGVLNDFTLTGLNLRGMDRSRITGEVVVQNIFSNEENLFSIRGDLEELATNYYDLTNLLPGLLRGTLPVELQKFGNVQVTGDVLVTSDVIRTDVRAFSQLGDADIKMTLNDFTDSEIAAYKGNVVVRDFNIGRLLDQQNLGRTSFNLNIDGRGLTAESLNTEVRGAVSRLGYNNYVYNNIKVRGTLKAPVFNGNLISLDPNLRMEFNGLADFSKETNVYDFEANVAHADLHTLNFIERDTISVFQGDIFMNMRGSNLNDAVGNVMLLNTSYRNQNETYRFDDLRLNSTFDGPVRTIEVNSPDVISGTVEGIFDVTEVQALFENAVGSLYTNYRPNKLTTNQYLEFDLEIYNKIVEVFFPEITLAPNTVIRGSVESDESEFRLTFRSPEINAFGNMMEQVNIQVDNTNPLFNTYIEVDSVATGLYNLSEFNLINVTMRDTLFVRSEFRGGPGNDDVYNLNLYHTINADNNSVVGVQRSDLTFKDRVWYLNENNNESNRVIFDGLQNIRVDSLVLSHQEEEIRFTGQMRDSTYKDFKMEFDNVDLSKVTPEIDSLEIGGIVNGNLNLLQQRGAYFPNTSLTVRDLEINDKMLGNLNLDVMGNRDLSFYNVNTTLRNKGLESLSAIGEIVVDQEVPEIDLDVTLRNFNLSAFSPLGGDVLDNIRGMVSGNADVTGNYKNPDISGKLILNDAGVRIPYLNVDYRFEQGSVVNLTEQQFNFDEINITDTQYNTTGVLDGTISHQNFQSWILGLNISTNRLLVLDTQANDDALYYGTGFIGGNASIYGPTSELVIDVVGATRRGTVFKIPINESDAIGDTSFIHFLSPEEKAARQAGKEIELQDVKGLELNFDLDVTDDALVEIEMDGSILRGKGAGTLLIEINTLGKFNMWGDFIVNTGEYVFNYSALQKRFQVRPGGSINWNGNPLEADLNISAVYEAHANPAIILDNPSISRRIPVDVVINLQGDLIQPDFSFDLEYPNVTSTVRSELEYKIETNANVEMQAFSLLALGQFYTPDVLVGNPGSAFLFGNVFEGASGLFNNLLADESGTFVVGLNYEQGARTPEQNTADRFGVTLSTQISDRVLINGQVGVPVGGVTETVIVGNLEIEFLLNEEGNLRAKIFNRENNIQYFGEELGFTQGVGLSYEVDFNTFKELIRKITDRELTVSSQLPLREGPDTPQQSLAPDYIRFPGADGQ